MRGLGIVGMPSAEERDRSPMANQTDPLALARTVRFAEMMGPSQNLRTCQVRVSREICVPVFSAVDLVRAVRGCGAAAAKGIAWRILREHYYVETDGGASDSRGVFEVRFAPEDDHTLALDVEAACELVLLVPGCAASSALRKKAVEALLGGGEGAAGVTATLSPRKPRDGLARDGLCRSRRRLSLASARGLLALAALLAASAFAAMFPRGGCLCQNGLYTK